MHDVSKEVIHLIAQTLGRDSESITQEKHIADLSHDSIQLFELLMTLEKHYNMTASYEDVVQLKTVGDIVSYIQKKTHQNI